jgi:hypothetical protein
MSGWILDNYTEIAVLETPDLDPRSTTVDKSVERMMEEQSMFRRAVCVDSAPFEADSCEESANVQVCVSKKMCAIPN